MLLGFGSGSALVEIRRPAVTRDAPHVAEGRAVGWVGREVARGHEELAANAPGRARSRPRCGDVRDGDRPSPAARPGATSACRARRPRRRCAAAFATVAATAFSIRVEGDDRREAAASPRRSRARRSRSRSRAGSAGSSSSSNSTQSCVVGCAPGSERTAWIDHDRRRAERRVVPRRPDPERPDLHGPVKRSPAVAPVGGDVLPAHSAEGMPAAAPRRRHPYTRRARDRRRVRLPRTRREELEHVGARFLGALGGNCDRDASDGAQRNALFSLSKKPFAGLVRRLGRQLLELLEEAALLLGQAPWHGDVHQDALVSAAEALEHRQPLAAQNADLAGLRPRLEAQAPSSPSSVGTDTVAPSAACVSVRSTVEKTSLPSRTNRSSGRTCTST